MKPVVIHEAAQLELAQSVDFYEQRRPGLGLEFEAVVREAVETISKSPERNSIRKGGCRSLLLRRFPFIVHYLDTPE